MTFPALKAIATKRTTTRADFRPGNLAAALGFAVMTMFEAGSAVVAINASDWVVAVHFGIVAVMLGICSVLALIRGRALAARSTIQARTLAILGSYMLIPLSALPLTTKSDGILFLSSAGIALVYCWVIWALLTLKRGFSVYAEARVLITRGPYAIVRHPLYSGYFLVYALIALPRFGVLAIALAVTGIVAEILRSKHEEHVLRQTFPTYARYAECVPAFIPRLRNRSADMQNDAGDAEKMAVEEGGQIAA